MNQENQWNIFAALAMPDHLHLLIAPFDRDNSISNFIRWFKRGFNREHHPDWKWQEGGFDRLLRTEESVQQQWEYIRQNPQRAGWIKEPDLWRYKIGLVNKDGVS